MEPLDRELVPLLEEVVPDEEVLPLLRLVPLLEEPEGFGFGPAMAATASYCNQGSKAAIVGARSAGREHWSTIRSSTVQHSCPC